jgi:LysM repeat protein
MEERSLRFWLARLLAPIAFFAAATLLVLIVRESFEEDEPTSRVATFEQAGADGQTVVVTTTLTETEPSSDETETTAETEATTSVACTPPRRATYRVRAGDTFESIAVRVCSSSTMLKELNPGVDSVALQTGQMLRIRPPAEE